MKLNRDYYSLVLLNYDNSLKKTKKILEELEFFDSIGLDYAINEDGCPEFNIINILRLGDIIIDDFNLFIKTEKIDVELVYKITELNRPIPYFDFDLKKSINLPDFKLIDGEFYMNTYYLTIREPHKRDSYNFRSISNLFYVKIKDLVMDDIKEPIWSYLRIKSGIVIACFVGFFKDNPKLEKEVIDYYKKK